MHIKFQCSNASRCYIPDVCLHSAKSLCYYSPLFEDLANYLPFRKIVILVDSCCDSLFYPPFLTSTCDLCACSVKEKKGVEGEKFLEITLRALTHQEGSWLSASVEPSVSVYCPCFYIFLFLFPTPSAYKIGSGVCQFQKNQS